MSAMVEKEEAVFRSAEMSLVQLYIPQEIARDAVYTVGQLGNIQFLDLNKKVRTFQRTYVEDIRRLDNVERQYRYFYSLLLEHDLKLYETEDDSLRYASLQNSQNGELNILTPPNSSKIDDHVENAKLLEERLSQMESATDTLKQQKSELEQHRYVLQAGDIFFEGPISHSLTHDTSAQTQQAHLQPNFITGVIPRNKVSVLEQILWRVLRGNLYFKQVELDEAIYDATTKKKQDMSAFIVFSPGDLIVQRIRKIAESLDAKLYEVSESAEQRSQKLSEINQNLADLYNVLDTTTTTFESELYAISKELDVWFQEVEREKLVFHTLNKFNYDQNRKILVAEGWVPKDELNILQKALSDMTKNLGTDVPSTLEVLQTNRTPPTYHRTNKFTEAFQNICDCYGIAQYREINAGLPTIVTFPFMFAIMFGDLGHGFIMFLAAAALVLNEKTIGKMKRGEIFDMAFSGRYILLLMGLFSMYTGFLYNDIFSKSMTLFKSGWQWPSHWEEGETIFAKSVGTYPIGLDWSWHGSENELLFSNSYKMKLSILMGFIHMTYSYMFSLANHLYFDSWIDIVGNFLPGLLFMQGIFGYLSLCIVYKWSVDWIKDDKAPPGLLNMLINMFLAPGSIDDELYPHQAKVQVFLLAVALICIPWLLIAKPLHFKLTHKDHIALPTDEENSGLQVSDDINELLTEEGAEDDDDEGHGHGQEEFSDVVIHQVIHTIEFCLNCVSHTASYLRLWALSLAHAQLSSVLWTMTIQIAFGTHGALGVFMTIFLFAMWFVLTCCVLVVMEGTSAMLHSLRLHWVESMSKFFVGDGIYYEPFLFQYIDMEDFAASVVSSSSN
ncbi:hypothetical protein TPHA_0G00710 [Tetrapisispora phaffii CBS 4417]|uniref:V-type proton ATPase subunit a n=1 Tax=Tetrapisispora phaffii (strain ATCC 24235 / CBS 4417 / NBRC 1672 / NRRL Y-8282 / UCD 70-5) TaxID=1071381 RepID=G8BVH9_TETPH|nr:hypothetical protein TPHA_0G00710 [Tetrapisispora phaffii CBS 4417]CCE63907.1 hypothetical protein TPHA_0G00710 [Tetrapisispora phaffii CBS 4417]